jgi:hypothetical protein
MAGPRLRPARGIAFFALPGAFLGLVRNAGLFGSLLSFTLVDALFVFTQQLRFVALNPGLFGRHLTPHDAPARARAYCTGNPLFPSLCEQCLGVKVSKSLA